MRPISAHKLITPRAPCQLVRPLHILHRRMGLVRESLVMWRIGINGIQIRRHIMSPLEELVVREVFGVGGREIRDGRYLRVDERRGTGSWSLARHAWR